MLAAWHVLWLLQLAARQPPVDWRETLWVTVGLVGAVLVGILLIWLVDRWRKRSVDSPTSSDDQLAHFRELFDRGEISAEEFERIRGLLGKRLRQQLELPPSSPEDKQPPIPPQGGRRSGPTE
jgi:hypothetical protein